MTYLRAFTSPIFRRRSFIFEVTKRYFLSNAFECKETWNSRLERPIFKKINYENMYYDLDNQYKRSRTLIPIDIDIYVNGQTDDSFLTEVEEMVYLLRTTGLTHLTLPTTHHAFVRLFLEYKKNDLVRILHDRLNYGIFPDDYLICYLIDKFVKAEDFRNAAKVATLQMFQENYSHELGKYLSLYAIHRYLLTNEPWDDIVEETKTGEEEEEEEEVKVRVSYLRNPYFDDHFDLTDGQHICGKSLVMISKTLDNIALNNSYKIMGLALYNKWKKLEVELTRLVDQQKKLSEPILYQDALNFSTQIINDKLKDESLSSEIQKLLGQIEEKHCSKNNLLLDVENLVKETVKLKEASEISAQEKLYKEWEILRENELDAHLKEVQRQNRLKEIQRRKNEMIEKEQLLYFFDNEDEINVICEKKEKILSKRNRQSAEESEKEYVPPEIQKRVSE